MKVLFAAGFTPIVSDLDASLAFYEQTLGISFDRDDNSDYVSTGDLDGLKHMGLWKLSDAAEACFGTKEWPNDIPVPQVPRFQGELREYMRTEGSILEEIRRSGDLPDELAERLSGELEKFKQSFSVQEETSLVA